MFTVKCMLKKYTEIYKRQTWTLTCILNNFIGTKEIITNHIEYTVTSYSSLQDRTIWSSNGWATSQTK